MAQLHAQPYPGDWSFHSSSDLAAYFRRVDKLLAEIPPDRLIHFPVADGHAIYFIHSERPLVLQHVPYGDAYRADPILIRGLRLSDVKLRVKQASRLKPMLRPGSTTG